MGGPTLTPQEREFIIQALNSMRLSGDPAALRQALDLIDTITAKLKTGPDPAENPEEVGPAGSSLV